MLEERAINATTSSALVELPRVPIRVPNKAIYSFLDKLHNDEHEPDRSEDHTETTKQEGDKGAKSHPMHATCTDRESRMISISSTCEYGHSIEVTDACGNKKSKQEDQNCQHGKKDKTPKTNVLKKYTRNAHAGDQND